MIKHVRASSGEMKFVQLAYQSSPFVFAIRYIFLSTTTQPTSATMASTTTPYLDTAPLLLDSFSPASHANTLIHQTNNPSDTPLDLSTPLQKILFDAQEIDTLIDSLTTSSALPLISHTQSQNASATKVLESVEERLEGLNASYERLSREVGERYAAAEQVRLAAERMVRTLRLGRGVQRVAGLARQLEGEVKESHGRDGGERAAETVLQVKEAFRGMKELERVDVARSVRGDIVGPAERGLIQKAQVGVREFNVWDKTFVQAEEGKGRVGGCLKTLYLLSPVPTTTTGRFDANLVTQALQSYLQTSLSTSLAGVARGLATLPTLDRALQEVSGKCGNVIALENVLENLRLPNHPLLEEKQQYGKDTNFLQILLRAMDEEGSSLASFFWRSLASGLEGKVREILVKGGVSARTLRSNRDKLRESVRECVERGYKGGREAGGKKVGGNWEREAAVMVGSVVGPLGR